MSSLSGDNFFGSSDVAADQMLWMGVFSSLEQ
jgi:hypothetical protein